MDVQGPFDFVELLEDRDRFRKMTISEFTFYNCIKSTNSAMYFKYTDFIDVEHTLSIVKFVQLLGGRYIQGRFGNSGLQPTKKSALVFF